MLKDNYLSYIKSDILVSLMGFKEAFISTRPWSFPMTIIIISVGVSYAYLERDVFNPLLYIITLLGVLLLHAAVNLLNDYFDYIKNIDTPNSPTAKYRPHPIITGFYSTSAVLFMSVIYAVLGISIGVYLAYITDLVTLYLGLLGLLLVYMYNGPPFELKYKALGELEVFIVWGILIPLGSYYVQTQFLSINAVLSSLPLGFFVSAVLLANNLRDTDFDKTSGMKTIPVIFGLEKGVEIYQGLLYLPYIIQVSLIMFKVVPFCTILTLITLKDVYNVVKIFKNKVPEPADPMTANILIRYGSMYLVMLVVAMIFHIP